MKFRFFILGLYTELGILSGSLIGIFCFFLAIYYIYYILTLSAILLGYLAYKNLLFKSSDKNVKTDKIIKNLSLSRFYLTTIWYWLVFVCISVWFFGNLIVINNCSKKENLASLYNLLVLLKTHSYKLIIFPLCLLIPIILAFCYFSFIKQENPFWDYLALKKIKNDLYLMINKAISATYQLSTTLPLIFVLSVFCLYWVNFIVLKFDLLELYRCTLFVALIAALFYFILLIVYEYLINKIKKSHRSLGFHILLIIFLTIILTSSIYITLFKTNILTVKLINTIDHFLGNQSVFVYSTDENNFRLIALVLCWIVSVMPTFCNILAGISYKKSTRRVILANLIVPTLLVTFINYISLHVLQKISVMLTNVYFSIIVGALIIMYVKFQYFKCYNLADFWAGKLPIYGKKQRRLHMNTILSRVIPLIPVIYSTVIIFEWPVVQFILVGTGFYVSLYIILFLFYMLYDLKVQTHTHHPSK